MVGLIRYWAWGWCVLAMSGRGSLCRRVHRVGDVEVAYDVHPVPGFTSFTAREMAQSLRDPHVPVVDRFKVGSHSLEGPRGGASRWCVALALPTYCLKYSTYCLNLALELQSARRAVR